MRRGEYANPNGHGERVCPHGLGNPTGYASRGCRCVECRAAHTKAARDGRDRKRAPAALSEALAANGRKGKLRSAGLRTNSHLSQGDIDRTQEEQVLTSCGQCGDWHRGSFSESRAWFGSHVCDSHGRRRGARPVAPEPGATRPTERVRVAPRQGDRPLLVA